MAFEREVLLDGAHPPPDAPSLILPVPVVDPGIELGQAVHFGHWHQMVATEVSDVALDPAFGTRRQLHRLSRMHNTSSP
jgi:hypothetical protein